MAEVLPPRTRENVADAAPVDLPAAAALDLGSREHSMTSPPGGPYGERLVVNTVDDLAERTPNRIYASVSRSQHSLNDGFLDITIRQLADAVNFAAWDIHDRYGRSQSFDVIAYLGVSDIRYAFYTYGAIKTRYVVSDSEPICLRGTCTNAYYPAHDSIC